VEYVDPNVAFQFEVTAGGAAATTTNIQAGKTYGLAKDATTGIHYLNLADTTNAVFRIEDGVPVRGVLGADTNVVVIASLVPAAR